jgi:hypothetical protein
MTKKLTASQSDADILDSHAFGEPVAGRHHLPATCQ